MFEGVDIAAWRGAVFVIAISGLIAVEFMRPKRVLSRPRSVRWTSNLTVFAMGAVMTRVLSIVAAGGASLWAAQAGWGVFNNVAIPVSVPVLGVGIISIMALDFAVWGQHVLSHRWAWLWRLHRVHHSDVDIDVTTALRFHPLEIGLSLLFKSAVVIALGAPVWAVLVFEILLNTSAMFNHANIALPRSVDRLLRWVIVTPDFHRVHHSSDERETNSNYGFFLSVWDRLFGQYTAQPRLGHRDMQIGLEDFRKPKDQTAWQLFRQPFARAGSPKRPG